MSICRVCGGPTGRTNRKTCIACKGISIAIVEADRPSFLRACVVCGTTFGSKYPWAKYCSPTCKAHKYQGEESYEVSSRFYRLRFAILARDDFRCQYCGRTAQDGAKLLVVDHLLPKSRRGSDEPFNLITACWECNTGKGDLLLLAHNGTIPNFVSVTGRGKSKRKKWKLTKG